MIDLDGIVNRDSYHRDTKYLEGVNTTPHFAAPELFGDSFRYLHEMRLGSGDGNPDIWSLGVTLLALFMPHSEFELVNLVNCIYKLVFSGESIEKHPCYAESMYDNYKSFDAKYCAIEVHACWRMPEIVEVIQDLQDKFIDLVAQEWVEGTAEHTLGLRNPPGTLRARDSKDDDDLDMLIVSEDETERQSGPDDMECTNENEVDFKFSSDEMQRKIGEVETHLHGIRPLLKGMLQWAPCRRQSLAKLVNDPWLKIESETPDDHGPGEDAISVHAGAWENLRARNQVNRKLSENIKLMIRKMLRHETNLGNKKLDLRTLMLDALGTPRGGVRGCRAGIDYDFTPCPFQTDSTNWPASALNLPYFDSLDEADLAKLGSCVSQKYDRTREIEYFLRDQPDDNFSVLMRESLRKVFELGGRQSEHFRRTRARKPAEDDEGKEDGAVMPRTNLTGKILPADDDSNAEVKQRWYPRPNSCHELLNEQVPVIGIFV